MYHIAMDPRFNEPSAHHFKVPQDFPFFWPLALEAPFPSGSDSKAFARLRRLSRYIQRVRRGAQSNQK